ncbi:hypothetical protein [Paludisphaera mucosa]|uniref:Uncharacterized protein n=1 Tax=Paludisphaera mucosa TaxID=3030827 RepID=A0ABT6F9Y0_9BACT|nr:hypothetical protein [Paludisphaera mucosa]MDG3004395.1 hypothetical protein [Paludisphaera mucosa]
MTRPWALGFSVLLLTYAAVGGTAGVMWLVALTEQFAAGPPPGRPFFTAWSVNLLFAPVALVGGVLTVECFCAAWLVSWRDDSSDLSRASAHDARGPGGLAPLAAAARIRVTTGSD